MEKTHLVALRLSGRTQGCLRASIAGGQRGAAGDGEEHGLGGIVGQEGGVWAAPWPYVAPAAGVGAGFALLHY